MVKKAPCRVLFYLLMFYRSLFIGGERETLRVSVFFLNRPTF